MDVLLPDKPYLSQKYLPYEEVIFLRNFEDSFCEEVVFVLLFAIYSQNT